MLQLSERAKHVQGSVTLAIDSQAKQMRQQGVDVVSFGAGEPDFPTPQHICQAAVDAMQKGQTRYTPAAGTLALRETICKKLEERNGLAYTPSQIVVTNGAKQALHNAICVTVNPGDEVIVPTPCWVSYVELIRMAGGIPVFVHTKEEDGFALRAADVEKVVTERTKVILLNTPNNPCGSVVAMDTLRAIAQLAVEKDLVVISDEIYEEFVYEGERPASIATLGEAVKEHVILVNGVSKTYAMTGWRVGYAAAAPVFAKAMANWQSHATGNVNSIAQAAAVEAIGGDQKDVHQMVDEFRKRRDAMVARVNAIPRLRCRTPQGAFDAMVDIRQAVGCSYGRTKLTDSMTFAQTLLSNKAVAVVPGKAFEAEGMIRLSYALSMEDLQRGMDRIEDFMNQLTME